MPWALVFGGGAVAGGAATYVLSDAAKNVLLAGALIVGVVYLSKAK